MRTKICGITSYKDAMLAIDAGADALGFVLYPPSPRYITPQRVEQIIKQLPPFVEKVLLFVNETPQFVNETMQKCKGTLAQLHFEVDDAYIEELRVAYIRVIRAKTQEDILCCEDEYRLVDAYCEAYGGSGKRINLEWFDNVDCSKIILAGGLHDANVADVKARGFYGVDVSSGVEESPGIKSADKVRKFIKNAQ